MTTFSRSPLADQVGDREPSLPFLVAKAGVLSHSVGDRNEGRRGDVGFPAVLGDPVSLAVSSQRKAGREVGRRSAAPRVFRRRGGGRAILRGGCYAS